MKYHRFSNASLSKLTTCEDALNELAYYVLHRSPYDLAITSGVRTIEEQRELVNRGASQIMNSRHLANSRGLSEAVDYAIYDENGIITWEEYYYRKVTQIWIDAAIKLRISIEFGGLWASFKDWPHVQLAANGGTITP